MSALLREELVKLASRRLLDQDPCDVNKGQRCLGINCLGDPVCQQCLEDYKNRIEMDKTAVDE